MKSLCFLFLSVLMSGTAFSATYELFVLEGEVALDPPQEGIDKFTKGNFVSLAEDPPVTLMTKEDAKILIVKSANQQEIFYFKKNKELPLNGIIKEMSSSSSNKFLVAFKKLFSYELSVHHGGKRLDVAQSIAGFPSGSVLKPKDELLIVLNAEASSAYSDFSLFKSGASAAIFEKKKLAGTIDIPTSKLDYGSEYDWTIERNGKTVSGTFAIASKEDQEDFEKDVNSVRHYESMSPQSRLIARAIKAKEWEYSYDMDLTAKQLLAILGE